MLKFNKTTSTTGSFKDVCVSNGTLIHSETGEVIDLIGILEQIYGDSEFQIKTSQKMDADIDLEG